jgi:hypothetical protein
MEPLWSPVVATGGNRSQIGHVDKPPKQAKTVAVRCDRLPEGAHGKQGVCRGLPPIAGDPLPAKEGVSGSSPSEGFEAASSERGDRRTRDGRALLADAFHLRALAAAHRGRAHRIRAKGASARQPQRRRGRSSGSSAMVGGVSDRRAEGYSQAATTTTSAETLLADVFARSPGHACEPVVHKCDG